MIFLLFSFFFVVWLKKLRLNEMFLFVYGGRRWGSPVGQFDCCLVFVAIDRWATKKIVNEKIKTRCIGDERLHRFQSVKLQVHKVSSLNLRWQHPRQSFTSQWLRTAAGNGCGGRSGVSIRCRGDRRCWVLWNCSLNCWHLAASERVTPWRFWHVVLLEAAVFDAHAADIVEGLLAGFRWQTSVVEELKHKFDAKIVNHVF